MCSTRVFFPTTFIVDEALKFVDLWIGNLSTGFTKIASQAPFTPRQVCLKTLKPLVAFTLSQLLYTAHFPKTLFRVENDYTFYRQDSKWTLRRTFSVFLFDNILKQKFNSVSPQCLNEQSSSLFLRLMLAACFRCSSPPLPLRVFILRRHPRPDVGATTFPVISRISVWTGTFFYFGFKRFSFPVNGPSVLLKTKDWEDTSQGVSLHDPWKCFTTIKVCRPLICRVQGGSRAQGGGKKKKSSDFFFVQSFLARRQH